LARCAPTTLSRFREVSEGGPNAQTAQVLAGPVFLRADEQDWRRINSSRDIQLLMKIAGADDPDAARDQEWRGALHAMITLSKPPGEPAGKENGNGSIK
jgi:hypothetical protein